MSGGGRVQFPSRRADSTRLHLALAAQEHQAAPSYSLLLPIFFSSFPLDRCLRRWWNLSFLFSPACYSRGECREGSEGKQGQGQGFSLPCIRPGTRDWTFTSPALRTLTGWSLWEWVFRDEDS